MLSSLAFGPEARSFASALVASILFRLRFPLSTFHVPRSTFALLPSRVVATCSNGQRRSIDRASFDHELRMPGKFRV